MLTQTQTHTHTYKHMWHMGEGYTRGAHKRLHKSERESRYVTTLNSHMRIRTLVNRI